MVFVNFHSKAQTTVFQENYSTPANSSYSTVSPVAAGNIWKLNRSGADFGGRISGGFLDLTNDATTSTNSGGWAFSFVNSNVDFSGSTFKNILSQNPGLVEWSFNFRQIRSDPAGFSAGSYGVAFILACDTTNPTLSTARGYAVILGQSGSLDSVKLVRFSSGLSNFTPMIVGNGDVGSEYLSTIVTYHPTTQQWELFFRNDGTSGFLMPDSVALPSQGTFVNTTHTSIALPYSGGYWQGSTGTSQNALFDNYKVKITSACSPPTVNASNGSSSSITTNSASFQWSRGNGTSNLAILSPSSQTALAPSSGTNYSPNSIYGSGDLLGNSNYVVFQGTGNSFSVSNLSPQTSYQLRVFESINNCFQTNNPASISFTTLSTEPNNYPSQFSASATSYQSIQLNFTALNSLSNANGYLIIRKSGSFPTSLPNDGQAYTLGQWIGDGQVASIITNITANSALISGLSDQTTHYFLIIPFNGNGNSLTLNYLTSPSIPNSNATTPAAPSFSSDFISNTSFVYASDIDPLQYQTATFTNTSGSLPVYRITLRDGGGTADSDTFPTTIQQLVFRGGNFNLIRGAVLSNGNSIISNPGLIDSVNNTITFSGLNITASDNSTYDITLRVSFFTRFTDNLQLSFSISSTDALVSTSGSQLTTFPNISSSTLNNRNRLEVTATQLRWLQQPGGASLNLAMVPSPSVSATDAFGNIDFDWATPMTITSNGTMDSISKSRTPVNGTAVFENVRFTISQSNLFLIASTTGFSNVSSNLFQVTSFPANSFRTPNVGNSSFPSGSGWEQFNGSMWVSSSAPSASTSQTIFVRNNLSSSASFGNSVKFVIESGGIFNINHTSTSAEIKVQAGGKLNVNATASCGKITVDSGATMEVLSASFGPSNSTDTLLISSGGKMIINDGNALNTSNLWRGVEQFQPGSEVIISNWNYGGSGSSKRLIENPSQISLNSDGAYFGHLTFNGLPTSLFSVFAGGSGNLRITSGNLTSNTQSGGNNFSLANANLTVEIGGNLLINSGQFSAFVSTSAGFPKLTVKGNLLLQGGTFNLNQGIADACLPTLEIQGNLTGTSGTLTSSDGGSKITFGGPNLHLINLAMAVGSNYRIEIPSGQNVSLSNNPLVFSSSTDSLDIQNGGLFNFNYQNLTGSGSFLLKTGGSVRLTSMEGLNTTGTTGHVTITNRIVQNGSSLIYSGNLTPQTTGNAIAGGTKKIFIEKDSLGQVVQLSSSLSQSDSFVIKQGTFLETSLSNLSGSGTLTMTGGKYLSTLTDSILRIPQLTGNFSLTGGIVELAGNGNQILRGSRDYFDVIISGSNSQGIDRKTISSALVINSNLSITGNPIFDIENKGITGNGGLRMQGGRLRISKVSGTTTPELTATALGASYLLTGGTIEWYGSNPTGSEQKIRGKDGLNRMITYNHIELNANGQSSNGNVWMNGTFNLQGRMIIGSSVRFKMDAFETINGTGSVTFNPGSTFRFAHVNGLSPNGQIQVSGTKNYGNAVNFVYETNSNSAQLGSEFPDSVASLTTLVQGKTVLSSKNLFIQDSLSISGNIDQSNRTITFGNFAKFESVGGNYFVNGWIKKIGNVAFTFPVGSLSTGPKYVGISAPDHPQDAFQVSYVRATAPTNIPFSNIQAPLTSVNPCEEWVIDETDDFGNPTSIKITLPWDSSSRCNLGPAFIQNPASLRVAHFNGSAWEDQGNTQFSVSGNSGWLTSNWVQQFSPFRLGSTGGNSLPVKLISFSAKKEKETHLLSWESSDETNFDRYEIEHSEDGKNFHLKTTVFGKGIGSKYHVVLPSTGSKVNYYRLKMLDHDGSFSYSSIQMVNELDLPFSVLEMNQIGGWEALLLAQYSMEVMVELSTLGGQKLKYEKIFLKPNQPQNWRISDSLAPGWYLISFQSKEGNVVKKIWLAP